MYVLTNRVAQRCGTNAIKFVGMFLKKVKELHVEFENIDERNIDVPLKIQR